MARTPAPPGSPASPQPVPAELRPYLAEQVHRIRTVCGPHLVSVLAIGSVALGDYLHGRSDVDIMVVVDPSLPGRALHELAGALSRSALPCPAAGLELVVHASDTAAGTGEDGAGYLLDLNTGAELPEKVSFDPGESADFWLRHRPLHRLPGRTSAVRQGGPGGGRRAAPRRTAHRAAGLRP
ncbi:nucleotidyltransferase domain-containing protein [Streptomyces sp. NWU339]|uniref:nucleotidyltransferase domain-containing protein n=1 Tax=Streptomyces sp. NWU339 TaxID=2185284 RepID=UPI00215A27D7|nr:nucleotidyltransferase domain-containing protein [Streptomyces sp. NWU339]